MISLTPTQSDAGVVDPRTLIAPELFARMASRIVADRDLPSQDAEAVLEQALGFLYACARNPGAALTPSPQVDIGWHTFLTYTREYERFCSKVAGRFIHHRPDEPGTGDRSAARLG
ncbi:hypothetical protein [Nonomuraea longicatena]|uniref:Uncharacterized protein n=1 Tax=Nonomuraea longicatena TaxID=83682 RepID=A0ABP3Z9J8_9ACTN